MPRVPICGLRPAARGQIFIDWRPLDGPAGRLRLTWREVGGPPVEAPQRAGFGSKLIENGISQLGGSATLDFKPDGLVCTLDCPMR